MHKISYYIMIVKTKTYVHACIISFIQLISHIDFDIVNVAPAPLTPEWG